jgi:hypothetical protein
VTLLADIAGRAAAESRLWAGDLRSGPPAGETVSAGLAGGRALGAEMIREGHLLHRGRPRLFTGEDEGLRLLTGDYLYAAGLAEICAAGDLADVAALADLISACAAAQARGDGAGDDERWRATVAGMAGRQPGAGAARRGRSSPASASGSHQHT